MFFRRLIVCAVIGASVFLPCGLLQKRRELFDLGIRGEYRLLTLRMLLLAFLQFLPRKINLMIE